MKPLMNTMMFNCRSGAYNDAPRVRRVCVCMCNCVCVCVRLVGWEFFFIANSSRTMYDVSFSCRYNGKGKVR